MNELIWKEDVIDTVEEVDWYHINKCGELVKGANSKDHEPLYKAKDIYEALENVKPVQPTITQIEVVISNNKVHLCTGCNHVYPECPATEADVIFGGGTGNDNICMCACFKPKEQPPVQSRHGKWIDMPYSPSHTKYMCSECGKTIYTNSNYIKEHKFCFSCGAKMEE